MAVEGAPRIGPPLHATSDVQRPYRASERIGLHLFPWQRYALDVAYSADEAHQWRYREIAIVASRQNGKSELLVPLILDGLEQGRRILHTAQDRQLPREVFEKVAEHADGKIRLANGQESIRYVNGGRYTILAPEKSFRGRSADDLIIDEVREQKSFELIRRAEPTVSASPNPRVIYLSNAGDEGSVVLNDLRTRGTSGFDDLAYLEWSADPDRPVDDEDGWREANPSIGFPHGQTLRGLRSLFLKYQSSGELSIFETEHLCRWVQSMLPQLVSDAAWQMARAQLEPPRYPAIGFSVDPGGKRASAVLAWPQIDGSVALTVAADVTGDPVDVDELGRLLLQQIEPLGLIGAGFDPWTDKQLARHFDERYEAKGINGQEFANASQRFVRLIESGGLHWQTADAISEDLPHMSRKQTVGTAFYAERASSARPITAGLAAIRAVWLASAPMQNAMVY